MTHSLHFLLTLLGAVFAGLALVSGESLRQGKEHFFRRLTPRMLLGVSFLGLGLAGGVIDAGRAPGGTSLALWGSLGLLASGLGVTLWTLHSAPRLQGDEALAKRLPPSGKAGMGLLAGSLALQLLPLNGMTAPSPYAAGAHVAHPAPEGRVFTHPPAGSPSGNGPGQPNVAVGQPADSRNTHLNRSANGQVVEIDLERRAKPR
jgi:hypothetical protein